MQLCRDTCNRFAYVEIFRDICNLFVDICKKTTAIYYINTISLIFVYCEKLSERSYTRRWETIHTHENESK